MHTPPSTVSLRYLKLGLGATTAFAWLLTIPMFLATLCSIDFYDVDSNFIVTELFFGCISQILVEFYTRCKDDLPAEHLRDLRISFSRLDRSKASALLGHFAPLFAQIHALRSNIGALNFDQHQLLDSPLQTLELYVNPGQTVPDFTRLQTLARRLRDPQQLSKLSVLGVERLTESHCVGRRGRGLLRVCRKRDITLIGQGGIIESGGAIPLLDGETDYVLRSFFEEKDE